jgi:hypothetical protein
MTRWVTEIDALGVQPYSSGSSPSIMQVYRPRLRPAVARLTPVV